jgi:hypothetical protein
MCRISGGKDNPVSVQQIVISLRPTLFSGTLETISGSAVFC